MKKRCPDEERLADYMEGHLSPEDRDKVEAHLSDCDDCLEMLMLTKQLDPDKARFNLEPAPNRITRSAVQLVAELNVTRYDSFKKRPVLLPKPFTQRFQIVSRPHTGQMILSWSGERRPCPKIAFG